MPILLVNPWNPGSADPGFSYPRAKIVSFNIEPDRIVNGLSGAIVINIEYGDNLSGSSGSWSRGPAAPRNSWLLSGSDYDLLVSTTGSSSESIYNTAKASLYKWLTDNGFLSGTIE